MRGMRNGPELERDAVSDLLRVFGEGDLPVCYPVRDVRHLVQLPDSRQLLGDRAGLVEEAPHRERELDCRLLQEIEGRERHGHRSGVLDRAKREHDLGKLAKGILQQAKEAEPLSVPRRASQFVEVDGVVRTDAGRNLLEFWSEVSTVHRAQEIRRSYLSS